MIKYLEKRPEGWSIGISGTSCTALFLNSKLILAIINLLKIPHSIRINYLVWILTFALVFLEIYLINSIASGTFVLFDKRFMVLFLLTAVTFFFGRHGLPYWSEVSEE